MEFISPGSPISAATAAFFVLIISSLSWKFFGLNPNVTGFILSIVFSSIFMNRFKVNILEKIIYIAINSFLIFSTALGGNTMLSSQTTLLVSPM